MTSTVTNIENLIELQTNVLEKLKIDRLLILINDSDNEYVSMHNDRIINIFVISNILKGMFMK